MKFTQFILLTLASVSIVSCAHASSDIQSNSDSTMKSTPVQTIAIGQTPESGTFIAGEHQTQGKVRIVTSNNKSFLEFDRSFKTSNSGPDLVVILHRSANVLSTSKAPSYPLKKGDYVLLSRLQKFSGSQRYLISNKIDLAKYKSVVIWCRKFNATFGTARLSS